MTQSEVFYYHFQTPRDGAHNQHGNPAAEQACLVNHVSEAEKPLAMQLITYKVITCGQHGMISGQQAGSLDSASGSHGQCPTHLVGQPPKAPMSPLGRTNSDFEEIQVIHPASAAPARPLSRLWAQPHAAGRRRRAKWPPRGQSAICSDSDQQKRSTVHVLILAAVLR